MNADPVPVRDSIDPREAYLALADELDPFGASDPGAPSLDDFDGEVVAAARTYATRYNLPFPMRAGIDHALDLVRRAEAGETR